MSRLLLTTVVLVLLLILATPSFAQTMQVMAVPKGTVVEFPTRTSKQEPSERRTNAYCLENKIRHAPGLEDQPKSMIGRAEIYRRDGSKSVVELSSAISAGEISISGDDGTWNGNTLVLTAIDRTIASVRLVTTAVLSFGDKFSTEGITVERLRRLQDHFDQHQQAFTKAPRPDIPAFSSDYQFLQRAISYAPPPLAISSTGTDRTLLTSVRSTATSPSLRFFRLSAQADCCLVTTASGLNVLHDIGTTSSDVARVKAALSDGVDMRKHVSIVITHAHRDHYSGLIALLDDPDVVIDQIIIGYPRKAATDLWEGKDGTMFTNLLRRLVDKSPSGGGSRFECITSGAVSERFTAFRRIDAGDVHRVEPDISVLSDSALSSGIIQLNELTIRLYWLKSDQDDTPVVDAHLYNIVTHYEARGTKVLDFGDADGRHIAALLGRHRWALEQIVQSPTIFDVAAEQRAGDELSVLAQLGPGIRNGTLTGPMAVGANDPAASEYVRAINAAFLNADLMKWPHHAWYPQSDTDVHRLKAFLKVVRPTTVLLSVKGVPGGGAAKERIEKIKELIRNVCDEETRAGRPLFTTVVTTEQSDVEVLAKVVDALRSCLIARK